MRPFCDVSALRVGGFDLDSARALFEAGFDATAARAAGYVDWVELKQAGYDASMMVYAGATYDDVFSARVGCTGPELAVICGGDATTMERYSFVNKAPGAWYSPEWVRVDTAAINALGQTVVAARACRVCGLSATVA